MRNILLESPDLHLFEDLSETVLLRYVLHTILCTYVMCLLILLLLFPSVTSVYPFLYDPEIKKRVIFVKDQKSYIVLMERIMAIFKLSSETLPSEETLEGFADPEGLISAMKCW